MKKQNANVEGGSDAESGADEEDNEGEQWEGLGGKSEAEAMPDDEEYVDEDKYTTVTVEAMEDAGDSVRDDEDGDAVEAKAVTDANGNTEAKATTKKRIWNNDGQAKPKKKKFRYESKAERQATRQKQKVKKHKAKLRRTGN